MSDTPRTDAEEKYYWPAPGMIGAPPDLSRSYVYINVARQLERELNEAKAELQKRHDLLAKAFGRPRSEDGQCQCAYCRRDFEAIAEHAGCLEMDKASLEYLRDQLRAELDKSRSENLTVRAVAGDKYPDALLLKEVHELRAELEKVRGDLSARTIERDALLGSVMDRIHDRDRWQAMAKELEEDKLRLDWLDENRPKQSYHSGWVVQAGDEGSNWGLVRSAMKTKSIRQAIDAARFTELEKSK